MLEVRRSNERGYADHQWLKSNHTFSFADYYDPKHMGFRSLRVINEDRIEGGTGFAAHPHRDMEIISYVVKGALEHKDSMGTKAIILPGEVQRMSAGAGITHSEYNHQLDEETHFFQIWIMPKTKGGQAGYGQKSFEAELNSKKLVLVISQDGRDGSIDIKQDADLCISRLKKNEDLDFKLREGRGAWVQIVRGQVTANSLKLEQGDAASFSREQLLQFKANQDSEFLLFDLA
jgi:quercetin 2,3-dioxygenase